MENVIDDQDYKHTSKIFHENLKKIYAGYNGRFVSIKERRAATDRTLDAGYFKGKAFTHWRGLALRKYPVDMVILQQLLWELKPATIFEMGTHEGGSALWMADTLRSYGRTSQVYTVDIDAETIRPLAKQDNNITFITGDLMKVEELFPAKMLQNLPHPWFVVEDSHINVLAILEHFHKFMQPGDYLCVEDTCPDMPTSEHTDNIESHENFGLGKHEPVKQWLEKHDENYRVDTFYNDFYGYNVTANWNGYIKRVK